MTRRKRSRSIKPAGISSAPDARQRKLRAPRDGSSPGGWLPPGGTQERAPGALPIVRARARDLAHNNAYASRAISVLANHAIGTGIKASIRADPDFEQFYRDWADDPDLCDQERRYSFYTLQYVAARGLFEGGDSLVIMRERMRDGQLTLTLQVIDPDQLHEGAAPFARDTRTYGGVEVYPSGQIAGYHVRLNPEQTASTFIPARDVVHFIDPVYPGLVRGIPRGAQALVRANNVDDLMTSALRRAKAESSMMGFFKPSEVQYDESRALIGEQSEEDQEKDEYAPPEVIESGSIVPLNPGESVDIVEPANAGGLQDYMRISLQAVASAYGVTYDQLTSDLRGANFSSLKAGKIEFNRSIDIVRAHALVPGFRRIVKRLKRVFEANENRISAARFSMTPPGRESIEPVKDEAARHMKLQSGTMTWHQAVQEGGHDPDEQLAMLKSERKQFEEAGVNIVFSGDLGTQLLLKGDDEDEKNGSGNGGRSD